MWRLTGTLRQIIGIWCASYLCSCAPDPRLAALDQALVGLRHEIRDLKDDNRRLWRGMRCTNPQVADFMADAARCESGQCPQKNLERVLLFMIDQKHVLVRLRPEQAASEMANARVSQLRELLHPDQLSPISRLLVLTVQVNMTGSEAVLLPEKQASKLVKYIRQELNLAPTTGMVGPFLVTCDQKSQLLESYARRIPQDKVTPGEPKSKDPQVVTFVFKVDC